MRILGKILGFIILSLLFTWAQASLSRPFLLEQSIYQPAFEFDLKGGSQRTLGRMGAVIPLQGSDDGLWFTQVWGLWDSDAAKEWNVGLGYRYQFMHWIAGAYGFFDRRLSSLDNYYSQLTVGAELLGASLELRVNGYIPTTSAKVMASSICTNNRVSLIKLANGLEKPLGGFDIEIGSTLTSSKRLEGFVTYYHFNGSGVKALHGIRIRGQLQLTHNVAFIGETSYDRLRKDSWFVGIRLRYDLGNLEKKTGLSKKMTQMIIRDIDVITDNNTVKNESAYETYQSSYETQIDYSPVIKTGPKFLEIKQFVASSPILNKIQSIILFSTKDIRLKLKQLDPFKSVDSQLITIASYDIQGVLPFNSLKELACFRDDTYWRIYSIGQSYGVKVYVRGIGGGDKAPRAQKPYLVDTSYSSNQIPKQAQETSSNTLLNQSSPLLFKPKTLGMRPAVNPQFIARQSDKGEDMVELLKTYFNGSVGCPLVVITGVSGAGKTQLAAEYIRQTEADYDGIFWVQADTFPINYLSYIYGLKIDLEEVKNISLELIIHNRLMRNNYKKILWVYDDIFNYKIVNNTLFNSKVRYIWNQSETQVHILVTSRNPSKCKENLFIPLKLFDEAHTASYIKSFLKEGRLPFPKPKKEEIKQLNNLLGGLPLAIGQAVDYTRNKQDSIGIDNYINNYEAYYSQALWLRHSPEALEDEEKIIWTNWEILKKSLSKEANLLLQMSCFLSSHNISKSLFHSLWKDKIHNLAKELSDNSLITLSSDFKRFKVHTLLRKVLQLQQDPESPALKLVSILAGEEIAFFYQYNEPEVGDSMEQWPLHIISLARYMVDGELRIWLLDTCGLKAASLGNYLQAEVYYTQALASSYGKVPMVRASLLTHLAETMFNLERFERAEHFYNEVLAIKKSHWGDNRIELVDSLYVLAKVEFALGCYREAQDYHAQALALQKEHYGEAHIKVIRSLFNLGNMKFNLNQAEEAKKDYMQALVLLKNHCNYEKENIELTMAILNNLGDVESDLDHDEIAKDYYAQALAIKKNHEETVYTKPSGILQISENIESALQCKEKADPNEDEPIELATTLYELGNKESKLGHYNEAKKYYIQALAIKKNYHSPEYIGLADTLHNLGYVASNLRCDKEAKDYYRQALALKENHYGNEHISLIDTLVELATICQKLGDNQEAKNYIEKALSLKSKHHESEPITLFRAFDLIGCIYLDEQSFEKALSYYQTALIIHESYHVLEPIKPVKTLINLGWIYLAKQNIALALEYYQRALDIQEEKDFCIDRMDMVNTLKGLVEAYQQLNEPYRAEVYSNRIKNMVEE